MDWTLTSLMDAHVREAGSDITGMSEGVREGGRE